MLLADHSEPKELVKLLGQSVPVAVQNLNQTSRGDYYFGGEDGKTRQFCRVQAGELLSNIDSEEDELRRYYANADESNQIIEGIISPFPLTKRNRGVTIRKGASRHTLFSYKITEGGHIYSEHPYDISSSEYFAWIRGLNRAGIVTYYTINYVDTAKLLVAIYNNEQRPPDSHTTLNRYYRPRIVIRKQDPFVKALMCLSLAYRLGIGEEKAVSIATRYKTIYDVNMAEVDELCQCAGIGKIVATKLLEALGREL